MARPLQIQLRRDAATSGGASIHPLLKTPMDIGLVRRILFRFNIIKDIRMWGLTLHVPAHRMSTAWFWSVRNQTYEQEEASALLTCLDPSVPLMEIGGGFGAVANIVNRFLDAGSPHMVVEMDPEMVTYLEANRENNHTDYEIMHGAVSTQPVRLESRPDFVGQQAGPNGDIAVPTFTLTDVWERMQRPERVSLFMDIEGMERELIDAESAFIRRYVQTIAMELHGHKGPAKLMANLPLTIAGLGFSPVWTRDRVWVFERDGGQETNET